MKMSFFDPDTLTGLYFKEVFLKNKIFRFYYEPEKAEIIKNEHQVFLVCKRRGNHTEVHESTVRAQCSCCFHNSPPPGWIFR